MSWLHCLLSWKRRLKDSLTNADNFKSKQMAIYLLWEIQQVLDLFTSARLEQLIKLQHLKPELKLRYLSVFLKHSVHTENLGLDPKVVFETAIS